MAKVKYSVNWDEVGGFISRAGEILVKAVKSEPGVSSNGGRKEVITLTSKEGSSTLHLSMSLKAMWKVKQLLVAMQVPLKSNFSMSEVIAQGKPFWADFEATQKDDKTYYNAKSFRKATKEEIALFEADEADETGEEPEGENDDEAPFDTEDEFDVDNASDEEVKAECERLGLDVEGLRPKAMRVKLKTHLAE